LTVPKPSSGPRPAKSAAEPTRAISPLIGSRTWTAASTSGGTRTAVQI